MAINVLNTDSGLSGKTIVNLEDAQSVTGLKSFNRSPNAPFAVQSGSAVVTNLDADKLDGQEGAYYLALVNFTGTTSTWNPTWTGSGGNPDIGNGTLNARYIQFGKLVWIDLHIVFGSTTSAGTGSWSFSLPVTAANANGQSMSCVLFDSGTNYRTGVGFLSSTTILRGMIDSASDYVGAGVPITWASGDEIRISGWYIAA